MNNDDEASDSSASLGMSDNVDSGGIFASTDDEDDENSDGLIIHSTDDENQLEAADYDSSLDVDSDDNDEDAETTDDDLSFVRALEERALARKRKARARRIIFRLGASYSSDTLDDEQQQNNTISPALHIMDWENGRRLRHKAGTDDSPIGATRSETHSQQRPLQNTLFRYFHDLPQSAWLVVLQFLDIQTLVLVRQIDRTCRNLLRSDDVEAVSTIWRPACERLWPWLKDKTKFFVTKDDHLPNDFKLDYARLLLDLARYGNTMSSAVDDSLFPHDIIFAHETDGLDDSSDGSSHVMPIIQYTGDVGPGDRCIRANAPLPRPPWPKIRARPLHRDFTGPVAQWQPFVEQWKPFVAPYALDARISSSNSSQAFVYNLEPRLVSYYEVEVLPPHDISNDDEEDERLHLREDCVAIGVGNESFNIESRMPGWTWDSHGYHGDDGGYYHGGGWPRQILTRFEGGDIVGCGIDYCEERVFFCKNGQILHSVALSDTQMAKDWYPVIGLDSCCPVRVNFGARPFQFDLKTFTDAQKVQVANGLRR